MFSLGSWIVIEMGASYQRLLLEYSRAKTLICKARVFGVFWKCARIGERLSPYVSICCVLMAVSNHNMSLIRCALTHSEHLGIPYDELIESRRLRPCIWTYRKA